MDPGYQAMLGIHVQMQILSLVQLVRGQSVKMKNKDSHRF